MFNIRRFVTLAGLWGAAALLVSCATFQSTQHPTVPEAVQVPTWSQSDMDFFLHGSMSTECVPETVLRAFIKTYPEMFPSDDLSHLGLLPDKQFGWPIGISRSKPAHLAGLTSVGVNCASCHVADVQSAVSGKSVRILGVTSHFDPEGFFGSIIGASYRSMDAASMKRFMSEYLDQSEPESNADKRGERRIRFGALWDNQSQKIAAVMTADPGGANGAGPGSLQALSAEDLRINGAKVIDGTADLAMATGNMLKLFHNMRAALHIPDKPPEKIPPSPGPGRNDAFGLLSDALFHTPQPLAPVKFGLVWNVAQRPWVHWDGNTRSPLGRNILAAVGLGSPLIEMRSQMDFALVNRQTMISEHIQAPKYPFAIDSLKAKRGQVIYQANCASCHDGRETDARLFAPDVVGTDPLRAKVFTPEQAALFNKFLGNLQTPGYVPSKDEGLRSTQKYWSPTLTGVWARSPYLHNGSVRTMQDLLTPSAQRPSSFRRGSRSFDETTMGYTDGGSYFLDTSVPGNGKGGHEYGTSLTPNEKRDLIEFLKTL